MCQAYEGERAAIVSGENFASLRGFKAALLNKPQTSNPYHKQFEGYNFRAWDHGWNCFMGPHRLFPFALELEYHQHCEIVLKKDWYDYGLAVLRKMEKQFEKTGKLPAILKKLLPNL